MFSTIGVIIDITLVVVVLVFGITGLKKGLLKSVLSLFSWSVCLLVAIFTAKYVAGWINGLYDFSSLIGNNISKSLVKSNEFFAQSINVYEAGGKDALINSIPGNVNGLIKQLIKVVFSNSQVDMSSTETIGSIVGLSLGHIITVVIAGILVFIVLQIVVSLLTRLFTNIEKTRIIGGLNKFLGLVLGLAKAAIVIIIFNGVLVGLSLIPAVNKTIKPIIQENTKIEKLIYNKTDDVFENYVIEGDTMQNWITKLWNSR